MPVSNPPFNYYRSGNNYLYIYSHGRRSGTPGQSKGLFLYSANGEANAHNSRAGSVYLVGGNGETPVGNYSSYGGNVYIFGGISADISGNYTTAYGGNIYLETGHGGNSYGTGGDSYSGSITLKTGNAFGAGKGYTGSMTFKCGDAAGGDFAHGGGLYFTGGRASVAGTRNYGGEITLNAGAVVGTSAYDLAGDILLGAGHAYTHGKGGNVKISVYSGPDGGGNIFLFGVPTVDPGISGAIFSTAGVLHIHP